MHWAWLSGPAVLLICFLAAVKDLATDLLRFAWSVIRKLVLRRTDTPVVEPTVMLTLGGYMSSAVPTAGMPLVFMPTTPVAPGGEDPDFYWLPPLDLSGTARA